MLHSRTLDKVSRPGMRFQGWRNLPIGSKIAVVVLLVIVAMAVFAPIVAPYDPGATGLATAETTVHVQGGPDIVTYDPAVRPSPDHLFGTDKPSRDIFSRAVYGSRVSLVVGLTATGLALVVASVLLCTASRRVSWTHACFPPWAARSQSSALVRGNWALI